MKKLILAFAFLFSSLAQAQGLSGSYLRLNPTALPTKCRNGDIRVDSTNFYIQVCNASNTWVPYSQVGSVIKLPDGSSGSPSLAFTNETTTGLYRAGTGDLVQMVSGTQAVEYLKVGSNVNIGYGPSGTVGTGGGNPVTFNSSFNGTQLFQYANTSTNGGAVGGGTTSSTIFQIMNGTPSGLNSTDLTNYAYATSGYMNGGSELRASSNQTGLFLYNTSSSGFVAMGVNSESAAHETLRITSSALTLNNGNSLIMNGSSSGSITIAPAAAAGTYSLKLPTSNAQGALYNDGSGNLSFASSGITSSGFVLTSTGSGSAPTWQAAGTPTFSGLTQFAPLYASTSTTAATVASAGTVGQVLTANTSAAPSMQTVPGNAAILTAPAGNTSVLTSTGSQVGWLFTVTGWTGTIVAGDTYTNNGHTYTAQMATQTNGSSGQTLFMSGTGATSGTTLTKAVSASGPATITFSANLATALYTTPTSPSPLYLEVYAYGGGGGGSGTGTSGVGAPGSGLTTFFGANVLTAPGGVGQTSTIGGSGGSAPTVSGATSLDAYVGSAGGNCQGTTTSTNTNGADGAASVLGGAGVGGSPASTGGAAVTNSGSGGGGAGGGAAGFTCGGGGSAGSYIRAFMAGANMLASFPYAIGTGGAGGTLGASGAAGGSGAAGKIVIIPHYQ